MTKLILSQKVDQMSSKRIAELTGKRHDHVIRDINNMLIKLKIDSPNLGNPEYQVVKDEREFVSEVFLNEELSLTLASGYSVILRNAIIKDWLRLKSQETKSLSRKDLALMVIQQEEELERLQLENAELKPKAEYTDKVLLSIEDMTTTTIAKELGLSAVKLNRILQDRRIQYYHDGHWVLYQKYIDKGYASNRTYQWFDNSGKSHTKSYLVWTESGRFFIHLLLKS